MGTQEELAALMYQIRTAGMDVGQCCVVGNGVFFHEHRFARIFSERYDKELLRVDGQVSGWLAKDKPEPKTGA
jgi:hypothetical protein